MNTLIPVNNRVSNFKTYSKTYFRKFLELCLVVTLLLSIGFLASCKKKSSLSGLPPSAPTSLNAVSGISNATISWVNPTNAGYADDGATPLEFKSISVIYTKSNSQTINTMGAAVETITLATNQTNVLIANLAPDTDYLYTVVVVNNIEEAATSDVEQFRTFVAAPPTAPANLAITTKSITELDVSFTAGANATSHALRWRVKGGTYNTAVTVTSPHSITGLAVNTEYEVEVTAMNFFGAALATVTGTISQATAPGQPGVIDFTNVTATGFKATWTVPNPGTRSNGTTYADTDVAYAVAISPNAGARITGTGNSRTFTGLSGNTSYTVTVTPSNLDGGDGTARTGTQITASVSAIETSVNAKITNTIHLGSTNTRGTTFPTGEYGSRSLFNVINLYLNNRLTSDEIDFVLANVGSKYKFEIGVGDRSAASVAKFVIATNWDGTGANAEDTDVFLLPEVTGDTYNHRITFDKADKSIKASDNHGGEASKHGSIRYFKVLRVTTP